MHRIIRALVYSENKEEALDKAKVIFERLCGEGKAFDYYRMFNEERSSVSGKGRWGNRTPVVLASSKEGKKLIDEVMKYTKDSFMENIKKVREGLINYTDEELFEEVILTDKTKVIQRLNGKTELNLDMIRDYCYCVGQYNGNNIFLYDNDGEGIRNNERLNNVLSKWETLYEDKGEPNPYKDLKIFVVPVLTRIKLP